MRKPFKIAILFVLTGLVVGPAFGDIIHVPADQPTIQAGINAANNGDIVEIADGTYTGGGNRDLDFGGKAITVRSENGPENCIIDGGYTLSIGFYFHTGEDESSVVDGFTITRFGIRGITIENSSPNIKDCIFSDNGEEDDGPAIKNGGASTIVANCIFRNNHSIGMYPGGGAIRNTGGLTITGSTFIRNSSPSGGGAIRNLGTVNVSNCTFSNNYASWHIADGAGGGAICNSGSLNVTDSTFSENGSYNSGGAISNYSWSPSPASAVITNTIFLNNASLGPSSGGAISNYNSLAIITNCVFSGNYATFGGGAVSGSSASITNCTFTGNMAAEQDYASGGAVSASNATITNSLFRSNWASDGSQIDGDDSTVVNYSNIEGGYPGIGNIDADPLFINPGYWDDNGTPDYPYDDSFVIGDYHLQVNSPSIDSGTATDAPDTDLEGISRPQGSGYDMGAYEYVFNMPDIIDFFDASVSDGTIYGRGTVLWLANMRLSIFGIMLETAGNNIEQDNIKRACKQLNRIKKLCDNEPMPQDFILGPAVPELADMILDLKESLECD